MISKSIHPGIKLNTPFEVIRLSQMSREITILFTKNIFSDILACNHRRFIPGLIS